MSPRISFGQAPDAPEPPSDADATPPAAGRAQSRAAPSSTPRASSSVWAVSPRGSTGLLRTSAARSVEPKTLRLGLGVDFFSADGTVRDGDGASRVRGQLSVSGSPFEYLELWLNVGFASTNSNLTDPGLLQSVGDLGFGAKGYYTVADVFSFGAEVDLELLTDVGSSGIGAVRVRPRALFTGDFTQLPSPLPLRAHLNVGYQYDGSSDLGSDLTTAEQFALGVADFDRFVANVGVEVPVRFITPYLEYGLEAPIDYLATPGVVVEASNLSPKQATTTDTAARPATVRVIPQRLTPGVRVTALRNFAFDAAVEIGLTPDVARGVPVVPPYNVVFLASYRFDPFGFGSGADAGPPVTVPVLIPSGPETGSARLVGTVVDRDSGAPIPGAIVRFDRSTPVASADDGRFSSQYLEGGPIRVTVSADGYEPGTAELELPPDDVAEVQVALAPSGAMLRGTVEGPSGPVADAAVQVYGVTEQTLRTEADGSFSLELPVGEVRLVVRPEEALATGARVEAQAGQTTVVALRLRPRPETPVEPIDGRIPLDEPIQFESGTASVPRDADAILAPVVDLLLRRPDLRLQVAGHTDNRGEPGELQALSTQRADAVIDLLRRKGVPEAQLEAQGYGGDRPLAPNLTRRGRAQNNRVELEVLP